LVVLVGHVPASRKLATVAYDEDLAERIRALITKTHPVTEQEMFGGLAFLIGGNMAIAASGQGGVLVRVDPAEAEQLIATTNAEPMVMGGRAMTGWLHVAAPDVRTGPQLGKWVTLGAAYASSLPPKSPKKKR
jgi:TfoX/Sxy family transcriptional regulator of competence genes